MFMVARPFNLVVKELQLPGSGGGGGGVVGMGVMVGVGGASGCVGVGAGASGGGDSAWGAAASVRARWEGGNSFVHQNIQHGDSVVSE